MSVWLCQAYLIPGHGLGSEEGAGQLDGQPLLVVLRLVLRHAEQHGSGVRSWRVEADQTRLVKPTEQQIITHTAHWTPVQIHN